MARKVQLLTALATLALTACPDEGGSDDGPNACIGGEFCPGDQQCVDGFCVPGSGESGATGDGDSGDGDTGDGDGDAGDGDGDAGDGDAGDGDGDAGDGDGDAGDGDGDAGDGDGDGDTGDGDPCEGPTVQLFNQPDVMSMPLGATGGFYLDTTYRPADDFTVPGEDQCWCVQEVVIYGTLDGAVLDGSVSVLFYEGDGVPEEPQVYAATGPVELFGGDFDYPLVPGVVLSAGHYWLSAVPLIDTPLNVGAWYWQQAGGGSGFTWAQNTDNADDDCGNQGWVPGSTCSGFDPNSLAFELHGVVGGDACP